MINFRMIIIFFVVSVTIEHFSRAEPTEIVETKYGPVRGEILTTVQRELKYSSFKGIPYAQPPVGEKRFQPPQNPNSWTEVLDTLNDPNLCPQIGNYANVIGDEDCLYLNVYTPEVNLNAFEEFRAVMVWIFGGGFVMGSVNSTFHGPDFLIEKDVVVVLMNYRLGALGFLTLGNDIISGNAGLKDQALALKWVNENIREFAGDPNKVTIFGGSAGAAAVELHHLSPTSRGLFRASIAMSGSPLNPWAFNNLERASNLSIQRIQTLINAFDVNSAEDISKLYKIPFTRFVYLDDFTSLDPDSMTLVFTPTVEVEGTQNQPFITSDPFLLYQSGDFYHVPHILGYMKNEFISFVGTLLPSNLGDNYTVIDKYTNIDFRIGINFTRQYLIENSSIPVFYYRNAFDYQEILHRMNGINLNGSGHGDDAAYIFYIKGAEQPLDAKNKVSVFREKFLTLWTNFAKYLDPSAIIESQTEILWPKTNNAGRLLEITDTFTILPNDF